MKAETRKEHRMRLPLEVAVGSGTLLVGTCGALMDVALNPLKLDNHCADFLTAVNFTGLLIVVAFGSFVLLACSRLARVIVSIAVAAQFLLTLSSASNDPNAVLHDMLAKMVFVQVMGLLALWLPASQNWLHQNATANPFADAPEPRRGMEKASFRHP